MNRWVDYILAAIMWALVITEIVVVLGGYAGGQG